MKTHFFFMLSCVLLPLACMGQAPNWTLSVNYGLQAHDKRLFDFPPRRRVLERQPEAFGTHQFGLDITRKVAQKGKMRFSAGGGLSVELATFERPFDHNFGQNGGTDILISTNEYYQFLIQFPLNGTYQFNEHIRLSLGVLPQLNVFTIANHTQYTRNYSWRQFDLYSVEFNPGIDYTTSRLVFSLKYRAFQFKKIDRILFNRILDDPRTDQTFETYNPFKIWLSVGYMFYSSPSQDL